MVRPELLRAASIHAEVAYLRDLKHVGDAKRVADQHKAALGDKERRFWAEAIKAQVPPTQAALDLRRQIDQPQGSRQFTAQLNRMHSAHSHLRQAYRSQQTAAKHLSDGLNTLAESKKRVEILASLVAKAQRIRANQVESRLSDDTIDLVTTSRTLLHSRAAPASMHAQTAQMFVAQPHAGHTQISGVNQVGISHVTFSRGQGQPKLSLSCAIVGRGALNLEVTRGEKGAVKVLIDPSVSSLASGILRDKYSIQSRLQALGIKVATIEVGTTNDSAGAPKRTKRSQVQEEEDEGIIA